MVPQCFEILHDGSEMEFVTCAGKASQAHPLKTMMGLKVSEAHLDALSFVARFDEGFGSHEPARHIPGMLVKITGDFPCQVFRAALRLKWTDVAVELGGAVKQRPAVMHGAAGAQNLTGGADVNILPSLPTEVRAREGAVRSFTHVTDGNVRSDPASDEPAEEAARPVGGVGQEPFGLQGETLLGSIDHRLGGFDLIVRASGCRLDIDDHCILDID